ncbi:MAG: hypothetical protein HOM14_03880 [Gammaproteobacteria bacterium]|jgi:hypothetical protein|nr:hypothetical protein [Gammaproteobacteria bacterium]MBT4194807.1 hypothetical protein [Gammaproteobacteria bacterium]MBT6550475.1 hypothetical protein [Gammaproteobacteria bacterium]
MSNPHIESLLFEANTLDGQHPIHLHFHDIRQVNTCDNIFYYDNGLGDPVACAYDSLHLLEPEEVIEARLNAITC